MKFVLSLMEEEKDIIIEDIEIEEGEEEIIPKKREEIDTTNMKEIIVGIEDLIAEVIEEAGEEKNIEDIAKVIREERPINHPAQKKEDKEEDIEKKKKVHIMKKGKENIKGKLLQVQVKKVKEVKV